MSLRLAIAAALAAAAALVGSPAFAEESTVHPPSAAPAAAVERPAEPAKQRNLAAQLELLPLGKEKLGTGTGGDSTDLKLARGVGLVFGADLTRHINVGIAPRVIFGIQGKGDSSDSLTELDLRLRVAFQGHIAPAISLYGFLAPGYAQVISPGGADLPNGLIVGAGGGVTYDVRSDLFVGAELGYQLDFLSADKVVGHVDLDLRYLHIGVAAGTRF
jgi:hypothetical protein